MQTHISENKQEVEWVKELFPERNGYLDVYDHYKLLGERSVFPHGVHLCDDECARLAETGSAVAFCPTSNFFLGSGLFNLPMAEKHKLNTLNEAYKVMQLQGARLSPFKSLYLATLGGARALRLEDKIGTLQPGHRCGLPSAGLQRDTAAELSLEAGEDHRRDVVRADDAGG
ncbi:amidohydrolase family domain-containing protein [Ditylenchus destructor]|nr:amidohydrolase family domain-containing protein [Ditylenchus destructor]